MCESPKCRIRTLRACPVSSECKETRKESMGAGDMPSGAHQCVVPRNPVTITGPRTRSRIRRRHHKLPASRPSDPPISIIQCTSIHATAKRPRVVSETEPSSKPDSSSARFQSRVCQYPRKLEQEEPVDTVYCEPDASRPQRMPKRPWVHSTAFVDWGQAGREGPNGARPEAWRGRGGGCKRRSAFPRSAAVRRRAGARQWICRGGSRSALVAPLQGRATGLKGDVPEASRNDIMSCCF